MAQPFSAGQDLGEAVEREKDPDFRLSTIVRENYNPIIKEIRRIEKPVICAVNGTAAGAAANIAFACDFVLASSDATFIQSFSQIGLIPDSGGTYFLPRLVGEARAKGLALLAEPLDAETAADWGLIWKAVDDERLAEEATALAKRLAEGPTHAYGLVKRAIQASALSDLDAQLDLERDLQREAGRSPDYAEGVKAFLEKRAPRFTGKA
jgi:2-(1,2-epoxy-1,2-dihydrophenyl)acetyl-CoA isomerase